MGKEKSTLEDFASPLKEPLRTPYEPAGAIQHQTNPSTPLHWLAESIEFRSPKRINRPRSLSRLGFERLVETAYTDSDYRGLQVRPLTAPSTIPHIRS